ncbi:MAG TPA: sugar nucleotide-binding protein, partial [Candidatus Olsenella pullicola]|nr:sugar nucleotide-binding protein [Candidatus Olsenella pullicola]
VVDDQLGRLTFTDQMAEGIFALLDARAPYGTYNLTGSGRVASWAEVAREVFELACGNGDAVTPVTTAEYYARADGPVAPRPEHSDLDLSKIRAAGFSPRDWEDELREYVAGLQD